MPLITIPYLIRVIGTEKFGVVSFIQALQYFFIIIVDYGFSVTAIKKIGLAKKDTEELSRIFNLTLFTKFVLGGLSFFILSILIITIPKFNNEMTACFLGFSIVIGQMLFPMWFYQGMEEMKFITYFNLIAKTIFTLSIFALIRKESDYVFVLAVQGLGVIITSFVSLYFIVKRFNIRVRFSGWLDISKELKFGLPVLISNFSVTAYSSSNYLILGFFGDDRMVGIYSIVEKIVSLVRQILAMFSQAVFPSVCSLANESLLKLRRFWKNLMIPFAIFISIILTVIYIYSGLIIKIVAGQYSVETQELLKIMIWVPLLVLFNIPFYQTMLAFNMNTSVMKVLVTCSVFSIALSTILTQRYMAFGTTISLLVTEFMITLLLMYELERKKFFLFLKEPKDGAL